MTLDQPVESGKTTLLTGLMQQFANGGKFLDQRAAVTPFGVSSRLSGSRRWSRRLPYRSPKWSERQFGYEPGRFGRRSRVSIGAPLLAVGNRTHLNIWMFCVIICREAISSHSGRIRMSPAVVGGWNKVSPPQVSLLTCLIQHPCRLLILPNPRGSVRQFSG